MLVGFRYLRLLSLSQTVRVRPTRVRERLVLGKRWFNDTNSCLDKSQTHPCP